MKASVRLLEAVGQNLIILFLSDPYLRIMMFSQSGRLVKKKKTTVKVNTKEPVFNETLNFEVITKKLVVGPTLSLIRWLQVSWINPGSW